jgi:dTDP-4-amino-4,6-dideoxygalactose transaminase
MTTPDNAADWAELERLTTQNGERYDRLAKAGARVDGVGEHYLISMLEALLGAATLNGIPLLMSAKLAHERWLVDQLAGAERSYASVMEARAKHEEMQRQEAIRRGQPAPLPSTAGTPTLKNAALIGSLVAKADAKALRNPGGKK